MAKAVMIIASQNFRDEELFHTREELEKAGIEVKLASSSLEEAIGMLGGKATAEMLLEQVKVGEFDAIVFVGGTGASEYFGNKQALQLAREFNDAGKIVAAICIAPSTLANAGILKGRKATVFPSEQANLKKHEASFTGSEVQVDGNIITASGPKAAREFGKRIAEALK